MIAPMEERIDTPWWRTPLQVLAVGVGLALLAAVSMLLIFLVARFADSFSLPVIEVPPPPRHEQNAKTRVPSPYGPVPWPDSPSRKAAASAGSGGSLGVPGGKGLPAGTGRDRTDAVPTGISVEEYRAAIESGRKLYLPNPQGECDLSGASTTQSMQSLEDCLARQAAR